MRTLLFALVVPVCVRAVPVPERPLTPPDPAKFHEAIGELLDGTRPLESVCVEVQWNGKPGHEACTIHGDGVTFLSRLVPKRDSWQVRLARDEVRQVLQLLHDAEFGKLPATVNEGPDKPWLISSYGDITVRIQGVSVCKSQVYQRESCEAFVRLVKKVLAVGNAPGRKAVRATSVSDGLEQIVRGTISPRALSLRVAWVSSRLGLCSLCLDGDRLECRHQSLDTAAPQVKTILLGDRDLTVLARTLHENRAGTYPFLVYSEMTCDAEVVVLGQGRRFVSGPGSQNAKTVDRGAMARPVADILPHLDILAYRTFKEGQ